jgi:hypothetical protein
MAHPPGRRGIGVHLVRLSEHPDFPRLAAAGPVDSSPKPEGLPALPFWPRTYGPHRGSTLEAALAGGNKQAPSKLLSDSVVVDEKKPLFGTLTARIDINEAQGAGGVSSSGNAHESPVQLVLVRKAKDAIEWDLTPEAVEAVKRVKD